MTAVLSVEELIKLANILSDKIDSRITTLDPETDENEVSCLDAAASSVADAIDLLQEIG